MLEAYEAYEGVVHHFPTRRSALFCAGNTSINDLGPFCSETLHISRYHHTQIRC